MQSCDDLQVTFRVGRDGVEKLSQVLPGPLMQAVGHDRFEIGHQDTNPQASDDRVRDQITPGVEAL